MNGETLSGALADRLADTERGGLTPYWQKLKRSRQDICGGAGKYWEFKS